jgi:hypothetical protein
MRAAIFELQSSFFSNLSFKKLTHNDVMAKLATELKSVIVTERLMSPSNMAVQKLEGAPPGLEPKSKSPSFS